MRHLYRNRCIMPMMAALLLGIGTLSAPAVMASEATPCLEEIEKYCSHLKPGEGILKCLREHDGELSSVCRDKLETSSRKLLDAQKICARDIETFCKGVVPGGGRILRCLSGHRDELASGCREIVTEWKRPAADTPKPADKPANRPPDSPAAR